MIIVRLEGGLGNQLFQYSAGRLLALHNKTKLKLDNLAYTRRSVRKFSLNKFNIHADITSKNEISEFRHIPNIIEKCKAFLLKKNIDDIFCSENVLKEKEYFQYDKNFLNKSKKLYLVGFWQNESYINPIKKQLLSEIKLKNEKRFLNLKIVKEILNSNSVSVHIRRGDYLKNVDYYGVINCDYYERAVAYLKSKYNDLTFYVFSDDSEWVKKNITCLSGSIYVSDFKLEDYEELILMSKCKHNIIANSSFSWWGAWLNQNKNKTVIAPKKWFNGDNNNSVGIISDCWVKI